MPNNKLVTVDMLKRHRRNTDQRYIIEGEYSPNTIVGQADSITPYTAESGILVTSEFQIQKTGGNIDVANKASLLKLYGKSIQLFRLANMNYLADYSGTPISSVIEKSAQSEAFLRMYTISNNTMYVGMTFGGGIITGIKINNCVLSNLFTNHKCAYFIKVKIYNKFLSSSNKFDNNSLSSGIYPYQEDESYNKIYTLWFISDGANSQKEFTFGQSQKTSTGEKILEVLDFSCIDLTIAYGSGNEPLDGQTILNDIDPFALKLGLNTINTRPSKLICTGYNQWDEQYETGSHNPYGFGMNPYTCRSKNFIKVLKNTPYCLYAESNHIGLTVYLYDKNKQFLAFANISSEQQNNFTEEQLEKCKCFVTTAETEYILFDFDRAVAQEAIDDEVKICLFIANDGSLIEYKKYIKPWSYNLGSITLRSCGDYKDELSFNGDHDSQVRVLHWQEVKNAHLASEVIPELVGTNYDDGITKAIELYMYSDDNTNEPYFNENINLALQFQYSFTLQAYSKWSSNLNKYCWYFLITPIANPASANVDYTIDNELVLFENIGHEDHQGKTKSFPKDIFVNDWGTMEFVNDYSFDSNYTSIVPQTAEPGEPGAPGVAEPAVPATPAEPAQPGAAAPASVAEPANVEEESTESNEEIYSSAFMIKQPCQIFYYTDYVSFIDSLQKLSNGDPTKLINSDAPSTKRECFINKGGSSIITEPLHVRWHHKKQKSGKLSYLRITENDDGEGNITVKKSVRPLFTLTRGEWFKSKYVNKRFDDNFVYTDLDSLLSYIFNPSYFERVYVNQPGSDGLKTLYSTMSSDSQEFTLDLSQYFSDSKYTNDSFKYSLIENIFSNACTYDDVRGIEFHIGNNQQPAQVCWFRSKQFNYSFNTAHPNLIEFDNTHDLCGIKKGFKTNSSLTVITDSCVFKLIKNYSPTSNDTGKWSGEMSANGILLNYAVFINMTNKTFDVLVKCKTIKLK